MKVKTKTLKFKYKNWKGDVAIREVEPVKLWYGKTDYHPKEQWFLKAVDITKSEERDFAVVDIIKFL